MITIKYKGVEATCTTVNEAIELIKKLDLEKDNTIIIQPNVPNPYYPYVPADPITHPNVTWTTDHLETYKYPTGICEYKSNLPDDCDNTISKINSIDNYKLPDDYILNDFKKEYMPEFTVPDKCKDCPNYPCKGGSHYSDGKGGYTNCIKDAKFDKESK